MVETAKYEVLRKITDRIEIRKYPSLILANTKLTGNEKRDEMSSDAFRIVAGYIFGKNEGSKKIAMTAPVMTQQKKEVFSMSFVMPSEYDLKSLPKPLSKQIKLVKVNAKKYAVIRFSGRVTPENVDKYRSELCTSLAKMKIKTKGELVLMRYNPPWTLPIFRRNELALEIK